jgi:leucyl-tRNA synthetase
VNRRCPTGFATGCSGGALLREPFPIVSDRNGVAHSLPESMLPVLLPEVEDYCPRTYEPDALMSEPETLLSQKRSWVEAELDLGDGPQVYRETNTMPNWGRQRLVRAALH